MRSVDDAVNAWILDRFKKSGKYVPDWHGPEDGLSVSRADAAWSCSCYSSWTRDDSYQIESVIGYWYGTKEMKYSLGAWGDFPSFIHELSDYMELEDVCSVESPRC